MFYFFSGIEKLSFSCLIETSQNSKYFLKTIFAIKNLDPQSKQMPLVIVYVGNCVCVCVCGGGIVCVCVCVCVCVTKFTMPRRTIHQHAESCSI